MSALQWTEVDTRLPAVGRTVLCKREGEWTDAFGQWNGRNWEGMSLPSWYSNIHVLLPMRTPTHWK